MANISKKNRELYDLGKGDNLIEFDLVNPTTSDVTYNLFNTTTLSLVPTIPNTILSPVVGSPIPVGTNPVGIAFNPLSNTMYVCNVGSTNVSVIDCVTNTTIFNIVLPIGNFPQFIAYCSANNTMYVTTSIQRVLVIDCNTNTFIFGIAGCGEFQIEYNPLNNTMYVCRNLVGVTVIDCNTNTIIALILSPTGSPLRIAYNTLNNTMYFSDLNNNVYVIDCNTNTIIASIFFGLGANTFNVTYNSLNNTIYVTNSLSLSVIDCNTNTITLSITIPALSLGSVYNTANNQIFLTQSSSNSVIVIDCNSNTIVYTIIVDTNPYSIAYNYLSNSVYTTNISVNTVSPVSISIPQSYIGGSFNYNEFIQDVINNPVCVERLILVSQNTKDFNQVINVISKDANGIECQNPFIPSLSVGTSQFQSGIGKVDFLDQCLVLGVNQYFSNFLNAANSTVKVLLIYKQLEKSKLLTDKKGMWGRLEFKCNPLQTYNPTKDDAAFDYFHIIPIKPKKPKTIRPFSIKDIVPTKPIRTKPDIRTDIKTDVKTTKPSIEPLRVSNMYGDGQKDITCGACEWSWNRNESDVDDVYVCHKCGYDNQKIYENEKFRV